MRSLVVFILCAMFGGPGFARTDVPSQPLTMDRIRSVIEPLRCIEGSARNRGLVDQIKQASDPLSTSIREIMRSTQGGICPLCGSTPANPGADSLLRNRLPAAPPPKPIKKECIIAALKRQIPTQGSLCQNGTATSTFTNGADNAPCVDDSVASYIQKSLNLAMLCLSTIAPVDSRLFLKKFNTESGFNFWLGRVTGMGSLTDWATREIGGFRVRPGDRFIPGRGTPNLNRVVNSTHPACKPFKEILSADVRTPPPSHPSANQCNWISVGPGFARNMIYSMLYFQFNRDREVRRALEQEAPHLLFDQELVDRLALMGYGPGGMVSVHTFLNRYRPNTQTRPNDLKRILNTDSYLKGIDGKFKEVLEKLHPGRRRFSDRELAGDTCVGT